MTNLSAEHRREQTGPGGNTAAVGRSNSGDLYAGHDGNVYKKRTAEAGQKHENGG
jgi:hypothetical protein